LYIAGRKKELIKTGAENVYPKEVENVLEKHPDISDVTVIGLADPDGWGEKVTAVVVPRPGAELTLEALKAFCRGKIAGYKIPKEVRFVDAIPRNAIGKVVKYRLAEALRDSS
jgi:acyl-CoA synthetase (AMP-forming)/AMP-acid ligase II